MKIQQRHADLVNNVADENLIEILIPALRIFDNALYIDQSINPYPLPSAHLQRTS